MAEETIDLNLDGKVVPVPRDLVSRLAAAAAANAGVSARHRELSLLLGRALESGAVTLDQDGVRALCAVIEEEHDGRFGLAGAALLREAAA
ncbi:MAG TPA: hypothetical protein VJ838_13395 [Gaiellaceae bacterium]|nr:hypothetical protein [Gaiellaceae bacterium]